MEWFKHLEGASRDIFVVGLEARFGLAGYARWFKLLEIVAGQIKPQRGIWTVAYPIHIWARFLSAKQKVLLLFLEYCENESRIKTKQNGNIITIEVCNMQRIKDNYTKDLQAAGKKLASLNSELELDTEKDIRKDKGLKTSCAERQKSAPALPALPAEEVFIELPLNDNSNFPISIPQVKTWSELFPAIDVQQELRKMLAWCLANPTKRKTKTGVLRFANAWLSKAQDKGGQPVSVSPTYAGMRVQTVKDGLAAERHDIARNILNMENSHGIDHKVSS